MKLDLSKFISQEEGKEVRRVSFEMDSIENYQGTFPILRHEPFDLTIEVTRDKRMHISGETKVTVSIPCDRCLTEVETKIDVVIDRSFPKNPEEIEVLSDEDAESLELIEESQLDVDEAVKRELFIDWPAKVLCRDDCKGFCPKCGTNLNFGSCNCEEDIDPRMSIFAEVFNKSK